MAKSLKASRERFIYIYVKHFRHFRTKKLVFPKPPNTHIRLKIRADKYKPKAKKQAA